MDMETPSEGYLAKILVEPGAKDLPLGKVCLCVCLSVCMSYYPMCVMCVVCLSVSAVVCDRGRRR